MNKMTCLYLFILFTGSARAQIASVIIDKATGNPLSKASISLQNTKDSVVIKTTTQDNGFFSFKNITEGNYILTVSYIGYDDYSSAVTIADNTANTILDTIELNQANKNLNQVVVTSKKNFIDFKPNLITLNVAQSPVATNGNVYDVIKRAPGVAEVLNELTFRGKKTLILINGRPTYLTGSSLKQTLSNIPASDIDKVLIIPNPSAKYDANAQSVIDIKLTKSSGYGINGVFTAGLGYGEQPRYNTGLSLNYRKNNINIYGSYNYEHNQQYFNTNSDRTVNATEHILENTKEQRIRYNNVYKLGADYAINKNSTAGVLFTGYTNHRDRNSTDNITLAYAPPLADSFSTVTMNGQARFSNATINTYYRTTFDTSGKVLTLNADYFNYNKKWSDDYVTNFYTADKVEYQPPYLLRDSSPGNNNVYSLAADYSNPIKNGRIEAGVKTTSTKTNNNVLWQYQGGTDWLVDSSQTNHFIYNENITAAYISFDKTLGKYEAMVGLRGEATKTCGNLLTTNQVHDSSYFNLFPNVQLQYAKNEDNIFTINYHKSIQRPDFGILNPFIVYVSEYSFYAGNSYLQPQFDNTFSFTYTYKQALNIAVNYTRSNNVIADIFIAGDNNSVGVTTGNINRENTFSLSANWGGAITKFWNVNISSEVDYAEFSQHYTKGTVLNNSGWLYQGQLQNTFKLNKGWVAEVSTAYHSTIPSGVYMIDPSFECDMGMQKNILHEKGKLALSVNDVFNTQSLNYSTNFMGINKTIDYKEESRFIKLQFTYMFGNKNVEQQAARKSAISDISSRMSN